MNACHKSKLNKYTLFLCSTGLSLFTSYAFSDDQTLSTLSFTATEDLGSAERDGSGNLNNSYK